MIQIEWVSNCGRVARLRMARGLLGRPAYHTAAYWVDGLLIDSGCAHTAAQLTSTLAGWPLERVVNTHSHEDHIGANAQIRAMFSCPILAHPDALPILENPSLQPLQPYRRLIWGWPRPSHGETIGSQIDTDRFHFQVIHTPGHSRDHICLFEPDQGWLFSGDAYIGGQDRALRAGYDIHGIIDSLKLLAGLPLGCLFSGSGTVRENGQQALREKVAYLEDLGERIRSLSDQGLSLRRIRRRLFGSEPPITYFTLGHFSGTRLVRAFLTEPAKTAGEEHHDPRPGGKVPSEEAGGVEVQGYVK